MYERVCARVCVRANTLPLDSNDGPKFVTVEREREKRESVCVFVRDRERNTLPSDSNDGPKFVTLPIHS